MASPAPRRLPLRDLSEIQVDDRGGVSVARLRGEIDLSNASRILSALTSRDLHARPALIVDLSEVEYLDSAGVRLLFRLARSVGEQERAFRAVVPGDAPIRRTLELVNATQLIAVDETEEAALARVRRAGA